MIGAAFDDRGGKHALSAVKRLFLAAYVTPTFIGSRALCAIGCTDAPLVRFTHGVTVDRVVYGAAEVVSSFERVSDDFTLRAACSVIAIGDGVLLLARGPYGGRPLYYSVSHEGRRVLACSRLAPLVACLDAIPRINVDRLATLLVSDHGGDLAATPYVGITRVQPCETLRFEGRAPARRRNIPSVPPFRHGAPEHLAYEFREQLSSTVARSISPFANVAVMAGGGLDSSGLLAIVAKQRKDLPVFAIDYGEPNTDRPHLRALAEYFELVPKVTRASDAAPLVPGGLVIDGAPFGWATGQLEVALGIRARREGADAIVTGMGGDDIFDGDLGTFARRRGILGRYTAIRDAMRLRVTWSSTSFARLRQLVLKPWMEAITPLAVRAAWRRRRARPWIWAGPKLREVIDARADQPSLGWFQDLAVFGALTDVADYRGQFELATGIARLDPYLESDIVGFIASIPPDMMFHDRRIRGFFRLAMKGLLPETVRLRPDKAWLDTAFVELFSIARHNPGMAELLRMEALADLGLVNPRGLGEALAEAESEGDVPSWLSSLLGEEAFVRAHSRLTSFGDRIGPNEEARA